MGEELRGDEQDAGPSRGEAAPKDDEEEGWQVEEVLGDVGQNVWGSINGRKWKFTEMPKDKLKRLIKEKASPAKIFQALREIGVKL